MSDYVPRRDGDFNIWQSNLMDHVKANATAWDIPAEKVTEMEVLQLDWTTTYAKANNKQTRTPTDTKAKDAAREAYEPSLRKFIKQFLSFNEKVTDSDRYEMGLTVPSGEHTPVPVPTTSPIGTAESFERMQQTITVWDEQSSGRAKPAGVAAVEIWVKFGDTPPQSPSELTYVTTSTRTKTTVSFDGTKSGQMANYWARWLNTKQEPGPWSKTFSARIL